MIRYDENAYTEMFGGIEESLRLHSERCISQCTGCMCNCRCSCSGGMMSDFVWEVM